MNSRDFQLDLETTDFLLFQIEKFKLQQVMFVYACSMYEAQQ